MAADVRWLGHAAFHLSGGGADVLIDPWLTGNPSCPEAMKKPPQVDLILVSHGHFDHIEDLLLCARDSGAAVVGIYSPHGDQPARAERGELAAGGRGVCGGGAGVRDAGGA